MSKRNIQYVKQDEPMFIKRMKEAVGYQEDPDVDTKRQQLPVEDSDSENERDDEKPQIVVLKKGDLSQEEVDKFEKEQIGKEVSEQEVEEPADGRIMFKKPIKSNPNKGSELNVSSNKKEKTKKEEKTLKSNKSQTKLKNKTLLSFDADEEEDY